MRGRKRLRNWREAHNTACTPGWMRIGRGLFTSSTPKPIQISSWPVMSISDEDFAKISEDYRNMVVYTGDLRPWPDFDNPGPNPLEIARQGNPSTKEDLESSAYEVAASLIRERKRDQIQSYMDAADAKFELFIRSLDHR